MSSKARAIKVKARNAPLRSREPLRAGPRRRTNGWSGPVTIPDLPGGPERGRGSCNRHGSAGHERLSGATSRRWPLSPAPFAVDDMPRDEPDCRRRRSGPSTQSSLAHPSDAAAPQHHLVRPGHGITSTHQLRPRPAAARGRRAHRGPEGPDCDRSMLRRYFRSTVIAMA